MNDSKQIWDSMASYFNATRDKEHIEAGEADNILIAWPVLLKFISTYIQNPVQKKALDYGCGTGNFCRELDRLGFETVGVDYAEQMITQAKEHSRPSIDFFVGQTEQVRQRVEQHGQFDCVVSIMTFQFIESIEDTLKDLAQSVATGGICCFAVFNRDWIEHCFLHNVLFKHISKEESIDHIVLDLGEGKKIPVWNRTANEYDHLMEKLGFKKNMGVYPPFTQAYIEQYETEIPTDVPEFMILGYTKV